MRAAAPLALASVAALLAATAVARDRTDRVPAATMTGPPVSCIPLTSIRETRVRDDQTIDFVTNVGRATRGYRVILPRGCPELGFEQRFAYQTSLSQLCSTDIITVLHDSPPLRGASCGLAPFQPVVLPARR